MLTSRACGALATFVLGTVAAISGCSGKEEEILPGPSQGQSGSSAVAGTASGGAPGGGAPGQSGSGTMGGSSTNAGGSSGTAGTSTSGTGGVAGGAGGSGGSSAAGGSGGAGGIEPGDTPPWRPLNVTASVGEHKHGNAGVDTRAKSLGKLVVDIGVNSGGYSSWLAKRGYHSIGAPCGDCPAPNLGAGRDEVGKCRMNEFANTEASVKKTLTDLHAQFEEEDWGYFLNQDGSVRWSDVAITGISHGATTAAVAGHIGTRMWRVVSRSGPRDNTCGAGNGECAVPLSAASYDAACKDEEVASWLDQPSKTPIERFFAIVGTTDGQCGDIMFNMHRTKYVGAPVIYDEAGAVLTGTNQFFAKGAGHADFLAAPTIVPNNEAVLNIAFGIPPENQNPKF